MGQSSGRWVFAVDEHFSCFCSAVHGGWSDWSGWTSCSKSCSRGVKSRQRECIHPQPMYGGRPCIGIAIDNTSCNFVDCSSKCIIRNCYDLVGGPLLLLYFSLFEVKLANKMLNFWVKFVLNFISSVVFSLYGLKLFIII